jgi:hypothetical protein
MYKLTLFIYLNSENEEHTNIVLNKIQKQLKISIDKYIIENIQKELFSFKISFNISIKKDKFDEAILRTFNLIYLLAPDWDLNKFNQEGFLEGFQDDSKRFRLENIIKANFTLIKINKSDNNK